MQSFIRKVDARPFDRLLAILFLACCAFLIDGAIAQSQTEDSEKEETMQLEFSFELKGKAHLPLPTANTLLEQRIQSLHTSLVASMPKTPIAGTVSLPGRSNRAHHQPVPVDELGGRGFQQFAEPGITALADPALPTLAKAYLRTNWVGGSYSPTSIRLGLRGCDGRYIESTVSGFAQDGRRVDREAVRAQFEEQLPLFIAEHAEEIRDFLSDQEYCTSARAFGLHNRDWPKPDPDAEYPQTVLSNGPSQYAPERFPSNWVGSFGFISGAEQRFIERIDGLATLYAIEALQEVWRNKDWLQSDYGVFDDWIIIRRSRAGTVYHGPKGEFLILGKNSRSTPTLGKLDLMGVDPLVMRWAVDLGVFNIADSVGVMSYAHGHYELNLTGISDDDPIPDAKRTVVATQQALSANTATTFQDMELSETLRRDIGPVIDSLARRTASDAKDYPELERLSGLVPFMSGRSVSSKPTSPRNTALHKVFADTKDFRKSLGARLTNDDPLDQLIHLAGCDGQVFEFQDWDSVDRQSLIEFIERQPFCTIAARYSLAAMLGLSSETLLAGLEKRDAERWRKPYLKDLFVETRYVDRDSLTDAELTAFRQEVAKDYFEATIDRLIMIGDADYRNAAFLDYVSALQRDKEILSASTDLFSDDAVFLRSIEPEWWISNGSDENATYHTLPVWLLKKGIHPEIVKQFYRVGLLNLEVSKLAVSTDYEPSDAFLLAELENKLEPETVFQLKDNRIVTPVFTQENLSDWTWRAISKDNVGLLAFIDRNSDAFADEDWAGEHIVWPAARANSEVSIRYASERVNINWRDPETGDTILFYFMPYVSPRRGNEGACNPRNFRDYGRAGTRKTGPREYKFKLLLSELGIDYSVRNNDGETAEEAFETMSKLVRDCEQVLELRRIEAREERQRQAERDRIEREAQLAQERAEREARERAAERRRLETERQRQRDERRAREQFLVSTLARGAAAAADYNRQQRAYASGSTRTYSSSSRTSSSSATSSRSPTSRATSSPRSSSRRTRTSRSTQRQEPRPPSTSNDRYEISAFMVCRYLLQDGGSVSWIGPVYYTGFTVPRGEPWGQSKDRYQPTSNENESDTEFWLNRLGEDAQCTERLSWPQSVATDLAARGREEGPRSMNRYISDAAARDRRNALSDAYSQRKDQIERGVAIPLTVIESNQVW